MQIDSNTPRRERTIAGIKVQVPAPFAEGQTLTPALADMLNQTLAENFSNNLRKQIEAGHVATEGAEATEHTTETAQALVDRYATEYEPGVRRGGGGEARVVDPVEREALKIASDQARALIKQQGKKVTDFDIPTIAKSILAVEANAAIINAEARKIVKARDAAKNKGDGISLDGIDLTAKPSQTETAEQAAA